MPKRVSSTDPDPQDRYRSWPDLTFYYGLGWDEIRRMPRWLRRIYVEELPRLKAERQAAGIDISSFPHMKKQDQERMIRRLNRQIGVEAQKATPGAIAAAGIAVKKVPMKVEGD